jgi:hypothetical protein
MRVLFAVVLIASAAPATADIAVGTPAPDFTATDSNGKPVRLADYRGRIVVLEWTNPGCPFVRAHYDSGTMPAVQAEAKAAGAIWLSVNSGAPGKQGHMTGAQANAQQARDRAAPSAYLLDPAGTIGRLYGAKTTPHMYVVGADGRLAYEGAIDDRPTADADDAKAATRWALNAVKAVKASRSPDPAQTRAYGCQVKYP